MNRYVRRSAAVRVRVGGVAALALFFAVPLAGEQKKGKQEYLDKWVRVPFCGSITITRSGGGKGKLGGLTVNQSESGQLTANITGVKDVVSPRTGRTYGFFLEGMVNSSFTYNETQTSPDGKRWKWELEANGQKQHSFEGKTDHWTELYVNRAQGKYRLHPPAGSVEGMLKVSTPGRSYTTHPDVDLSGPAPAEVWAVDRVFNPAKGVISDSATFTWTKPIVGGAKSGFSFIPDHLTYRPSEEKLKSKGKVEEAAGLMNQALPTGVVTFNVSWNLNLDTGSCQRTVQITSPTEDQEFFFGTPGAPKVLVVPTLAEAKPKSYEQIIYPWDMSDIDGSTKELKSYGSGCGGIINDTPVKGPCVRFRFENLPKDNAEFGKKTITADIAAPVHIKVFYKKFGKDNPEGKDDNWFYYWKQGAVPGLDQFKYVDPPNPDCADCSGWFLGPDELVVQKDAALCQEADTITLYERLPGFVNPGSRDDITESEQIEAMKDDRMIRPFRTIELPEAKGVDKCHVTVLHELKHKWVYDTFNDAIESGAKLDRDGDGLPDMWEILTQPVYQFDPFDPDTHFIRLQWHPDYWWDGDNEVLAREAERNHAAVHELDWARPGKQSEDKDECNARP